ncbi:huntingtin-interacting protein K-like [Lepus europaeus]|uniref:huntingtin-interacting protein K-like n=1 Tax=Lepus europaeus TaxID=9983 RepID=UPI002B45DC34|nr:huntingtin-interacting protein K-like [Lepus europaeus]
MVLNVSVEVKHTPGVRDQRGVNFGSDGRCGVSSEQDMESVTQGDMELELETETKGPEWPLQKPQKPYSKATDLELVTDYAGEKEIQGSNLEMTRSITGDRLSGSRNLNRQEKELAKVTIKKEDLEPILTEKETSQAAAKTSLQKHTGNMVEAFIALTN